MFNVLLNVPEYTKYLLPTHTYCFKNSIKTYSLCFIYLSLISWVFMLIFFFFQWNVLTDIKGICYFPNNPIRINFQNNHDHFYSSLRCISWDHVGVHMSIWTYLAKQREQLQTKLMLQRRTCGSPPKDRPLSCDKGIGWFKSGLEQEKRYNWASTQRGRSVKKAFRKKKERMRKQAVPSLDFIRLLFLFHYKDVLCLLWCLSC